MPTKTSTQPILVAVRAALGLGVLDALSDRVSVALMERSVAAADHRTATDAAVASILRGDEIPADLGADVARARHEAEANNAAVAILTEAQRQLPETFRAHCQARGDEALAIVRAEVDEVIDAAEPVFASLGTVTDAEQAIQAAQADAWLQARQLSVRLAEARAAQAVVVSAALDVTRDGTIPGDAATARGALLVDYLGSLREPWTYEATLMQRFDQRLNELRNGQLPQRSDYLGNAVTAPVHRLPWVPTGDPIAALRWTVMNGAQLWVPGLGELVDAEHEARELAASAGYSRHPHQPAESWERRTKPAPAQSMISQTTG
jgi:hypothetical protein